MTLDLTSLFETYFAKNRGPVQGDPDGRQAPNYGVTASLDGKVIEMTLTFRAGSAYCCCESGCHLALFETERWDRLRGEMSVHRVVAPDRLSLRLTVVVEEGALFFDFSRPDPARRGWYAFKPVSGHKYQLLVDEKLCET